MKNKSTFGLLFLFLFFGIQVVAQKSPNKKPRELYTYGFGGIEDMDVSDAVEMLDRLGYAGIGEGARKQIHKDRLDEYNKWSEKKGDDFNVYSAYMAHRFGEFDFSDKDHRAAIDRLEGTDGHLWLWVRDNKPDGTVTPEKVEAFIQGILDYAITKNVKVVLYPHYNTWFPTTADAIKLVNKIDHPNFGVAINLCHELMSFKGDELKETFKLAKGKLFDVVISGALVELDTTSVSSMNASTIHSLDKSAYDLRPYMKLIKKSSYDGPVGFINFRLENPEDYLKRSIDRWNELCMEVGLYKSEK
ncbi:MAG: sugar phosphate isomerase/epimerase [Cyclobacteriaceae bacterium]|jgi:sugar phosphate isomerase/epimerase